jgi:hypothetical protein
MSSEPLVRLRWYELWMLRFLSRSPRIARITVQQFAPEPDFVGQLEALYHGPSAEGEREG